MQLDAGLDTSYCNTPILLNATFSSNVTYIQWSSNYNFTDTLSSSSDLTVASIARFYIKVSDGNCVQIDSVDILGESINIDIYANDVCKGEPTLVGVTNLNPNIPITSYEWNSNNLDTAKFIDYPELQRWYTVEVINIEGCIIKDSVFVNVYEMPIIDSIWASDNIIFKGEEVTLSVSTEDNIIWEDFFNSNFSQKLFPTKTKCYQLEVNNIFNCVIKDSICINVRDVFCNSENLKIPTAFSPNEDEINDTYFIEDGDGIITDFTLEIFNRLGQKVFSTKDVFKHWNGDFRGKKLNPQVFDFYLEIECIGEKKLFHKGNITLIR